MTLCFTRCKNASRYKGIYPPTCNNGRPCHTCQLKYQARYRAIQSIIDCEQTVLRVLAKWTRRENDKWWRDPKTGRKLKHRNKGEMIALMHSELSEALEGHRKGTMDSHLPHLHAEPVELADLYIRLMDYVGEYWADEFAQAVVEKREYNRTRADHTTKARLAKGGKKF